MLEEFVVIGIVMAITELIKVALKKYVREDLVTQLIPLVVLVLAGGMNVLNAVVFNPDMELTVALQEGLTLGALAGGIYSMGKAVLGKS